MTTAATTIDYVSWVRRANSRWIVHHGLSVNASAYLEHLERTDSDRLRRSCRRAYLLARERPPEEDPKPWFYSGLFSLATMAEADTYLSRHWLLRMVLTAASLNPTGSSSGHEIDEPVSESTMRKILAIRQAVARLPARESTSPTPRDGS